jgi:UDP-N-acetylmuramoylalanine--D-glutamate ligase
MIPISIFAGRRVAIFGLARSGLAAARALRIGGASVVCWDDGAAGRDQAASEGLTVADLTTADWREFVALVLTPGVPLTHPRPHWTVERAKAAGVAVIGDTELFFRELQRSPEANRPRIVAITGTNGKSTTTALTAHLLRSAGQQVAVGGNIGQAVLGLSPFSDTEVYVLELSSYQIDLTPSLAPDVGILLNLSPDHLDRHGSMENYIKVKERLVAGARTAIVGLDDPGSRSIAARRLAASGQMIGIHVTQDPTRSKGVVSESDITAISRDGGEVMSVAPEGAIVPRDRAPIASLDGIATLRGAHNSQNATAALCAGLALGLPADTLAKGLRSFPGLAHRMELLGRLGDVLVVNDSKATNADSAAKGLASFTGGIGWILGGLAKEGGIAPLEPLFGRVAKAYLIGKAGPEFAETLRRAEVPCQACGTLEQAVSAIVEDVDAGIPIKVVLLSPACASFDQFKDFEDRGDRYRALIQGIAGFEPYAGDGRP